MKYRKIIYVTSLLTLCFISSPSHGQSKSKEDLGNALVKSILSKDLESFKALLLPEEVGMKFLENDVKEDSIKDETGMISKSSKDSYNNVIVAQYEKNFWEIVNLNENNKIDWSHLNFVILYKYSSEIPEYDPFLIHTRLLNSDYNHFYFSAVRYKGAWYFEDKMEITKGEKYAPHD